MNQGVSVLIPSIGKRRKTDLTRCLSSVTAQERFPDAIHVGVDTEHRGGWWARNKVLYAVNTEFVAFIDDDDVMLPQHLRRLLEFQEETGADLVYPWFELERADDFFTADNILKTMHNGELVNPLGIEFGQEQADYLRVDNFIPVTCLVRTELAQYVGFPSPPEGLIAGGNIHAPDHQEEWGFQQRLLDEGAKFAHLPERTWVWRHHFRNCSGKPDGADAKYGVEA